MSEKFKFIDAERAAAEEAVTLPTVARMCAAGGVQVRLLRVEQDRDRMNEPPSAIAEFREYCFEAWYCQPGHEGSHEKGGVEGEGGRFRRNHCVPMLVVDSIDELNALLEAADDADDARRVGNRSISVGQDWDFEKTLAFRWPTRMGPIRTVIVGPIQVDIAIGPCYINCLTEGRP